MIALLAHLICKPIKAGVSFSWKGAWEFDQMSGTGRVTLGKDGRLKDGTSRATIDVANETLSSIRNKPPVIAVDAGKEILVIFDAN